MKRVGFINGMRIKGAATNVQRVRAVKHVLAGGVALTAAPVTSATNTGGVATKMTWSPTLGLTGTAGGRNYVKGKFVQKGTGKQTMNIYVKTVGGTATVKKAVTGTPTAQTTTYGTAPIDVPGTLVIKGKGATKVKTMTAKTLSVNALTTMLM